MMDQQPCRQCKDGCRKRSGDANGSEHKIIPWPTISNVQIALEDKTYAEQLRGLLEADGKHRVHMVAEPNPSLAGVLVLDETTVASLVVPEGKDAMRFFVLANQAADPTKLWRAGVRRLLAMNDPPELVLSAILYTELLLSQKNL
jgi:hypothetical protein